MSTKFTPGPWSIEFTTGLRDRSIVIVNRDHDGDDWDIATVHSGPVNAHLIAAAPELYAVVLAASNFLQDMHIQPVQATVDESVELMSLATAVLAKARGES